MLCALLLLKFGLCELAELLSLRFILVLSYLCGHVTGTSLLLLLLQVLFLLLLSLQLLPHLLLLLMHTYPRDTLFCTATAAANAGAASVASIAVFSPLL